MFTKLPLARNIGASNRTEMKKKTIVMENLERVWIYVKKERIAIE